MSLFNRERRDGWRFVITLFLARNLSPEKAQRRTLKKLNSLGLI